MDASLYAERLSTEPSEADEVLAHAVPPESWLFRHAAAFDTLRSHMSAAATAPMRLASLGCACGAEAFSMAAVAASLGRTARDTRIVAVDRNASSLRVARTGRVSSLGQRSPLPTWAAAWFEAAPDGGLALKAEPLAMIEWVHADLLQPNAHAVFDVAMCRNVAIYLDEPARAGLARNLAGWVRPGGLLFVGHADPVSLWAGDFAQTGVPAAFALRRVADRHIESAAPTRTEAAPPGTPASPAEESMTFERLQALADAGDTTSATVGVRRWLSTHPMHVEAWWLQGCLALARADADEAARCLDRVLYLDPMHTLALLQSSALAEARGDRMSADRLRLRAARASCKERTT